MNAPEPYFDDGQVTVHLGDCLDVLAGMADCSVDAVVTDPPYGLEFMGREWDTFKPSGARIRRPSEGDQSSDRAHNATTSLVARNAPEAYVAGQPFQAWCHAWASECLRVLKPGGHMLAFGGTRTWHRLTCAVEDAGFEIRDSITWLYGSGFPKSLDVSKAIDKAAGAERPIISTIPDRWAGKGDVLQRATQDGRAEAHITAPATAAAAAAAGLGTALKPAHEPIVVARKPLAGTVAANVLAYGTGALNIGGCRVNPGTPVGDGGGWAAHRVEETEGWNRPYVNGAAKTEAHDAGRWPSNVLLTHSADCEPVGTRDVRSDGHHPAARGASGYEGGLHGQSELAERKSDTETVEAWSCAPGCPAAELDRQSGVTVSTGGKGAASQITALGGSVYGEYSHTTLGRNAGGLGDSGGASRFFPVFRYEAKAPASERPRLADGTAHPTVKPLDLMRWLVRLVTPPGGLVLDPFGGSGTTAEACIIEGFRCVLVEKDPAHAELIKARLAKPIQPDLFGGAAL